MITWLNFEVESQYESKSEIQIKYSVSNVSTQQIFQVHYILTLWMHKAIKYFTKHTKCIQLKITSVHLQCQFVSIYYAFVFKKTLRTMEIKLRKMKEFYNNGRVLQTFAYKSAVKCTLTKILFISISIYFNICVEWSL